MLATVQGESFTTVSEKAAEVLRQVDAVPTEDWREFYEQRDFYTPPGLEDLAKAVLLLRGEPLVKQG